MEERLNTKADGEEIAQGYSDENVAEELGYQIQNLSLRDDLVITHYEQQKFLSVCSKLHVLRSIPWIH